MGSWWMIPSLRWLADLSTLHTKPMAPALQSWSYHLTPSNPLEGKHTNPAWTCCPASQLKPAAHVTDQQTFFWKAECEGQCKKIFWSRYHCESLIRPLSLHTGLPFHTTLTKAYYFHSFQHQKLQNLLSCQHPLLWIVLPNRANLAEVAWNPLEGWGSTNTALLGTLSNLLTPPKQY